MCGRFTLTQPKKIESIYKTKNKLPLFKASWNVAPSWEIPTITRNSPNKITMMKWGFLFSKTSNSGTINIRSESTKDKPFFKHFLLHKRCIIPADGFYEWGMLNLEGKEEKYPFYFYLKGNQLFGFAALYNDFLDNKGKRNFSCAILTCPPNEILKKVHNRMPVVLEKENEEKWLNSDNQDFNDIYILLKPFPPKNINFYPVSKRVNSPRNDDESLITPLALKQINKLF